MSERRDGGSNGCESLLGLPVCGEDGGYNGCDGLVELNV